MKKNNIKNIDDLISSELDYFQPMELRSINSSINDKKKWGLETVRERHLRVSLEVYNQLGQKIRYGPFKGMHLTNNPWWGQYDLGSQCLGVYETEILEQFDKIKYGTYDYFIDIGAGDGYYAIGMLYSKKIDKVLCYEIEPKGQKVIFENWKKNGSIGNIKIMGNVSISNIFENIKDNANNLVLIDIEGNEFELVNEHFLKTFSKSTIIIEIHNWVDCFNQKYEALLRCANKYFEISILNKNEMVIKNFHELRDMTDDNRYLLMSERRPCQMRFLKLTPRIS